MQACDHELKAAIGVSGKGQCCKEPRKTQKDSHVLCNGC